MIKNKIIICTSEYTTSKNFGGLAIFLEKFIKVLQTKYYVYLVTASNKTRLTKDKNLTIYHTNTELLILKLIKFFSKNFFYLIQSLLLNLTINKIIKKNDNKIIAVHFSNYQNLSFFYKNNIPVITRLSSLYTLWLKRGGKFIEKFIEKYSLNKSNIILSPSSFLINELKRSYNLKAFYLPPIAGTGYSNIKKIKNKKKFILVFGSISHGKGSKTIEKFINSILKLNKKLDFIWIGSVDKEFYKSNHQFKNILKSKTNFSDRVLILNKMKQSKLFQYIKKAEIIILPSIRDNSPNACLESLLLKKIVIARDRSGYNDLIINNFNGFLFNKNDKNSNLLKVLSKALNLSKAKKKKILKNIEKYNKKFDPKNVVDIYKNYLDKIHK